MAYTFAQGAAVSWTTLSSKAFAAMSPNATAGSLIVVGIIPQSDKTVSSITDTLSNTYQKACSNTGGHFGENNEIWYAYNSGAGANTITVNYSGACSGIQAFGEYLGGLSASDPLDKINSLHSASGANPNCDLTGVAANALLFFVINGDNDPGTTASTPSSTSLASNNIFTWESFGYLLDSGAAGNQTIEWTMATGEASLSSASFLLTAAGSAVPVKMNIQRLMRG